MGIPMVSIIIPVHNSEAYLSACIDSVINQTYCNFELILVNDGSTDKSGHICDEFSRKDKRIRVLHKKNGGVSYARNNGIDLSRGKYIMFCDSDDILEPNLCAELIKSIHNESLVICGYFLHNKRGKSNIKTKKIFNDEKEILKINKEDIFYVYENNLLNPLWNKMYFSETIKVNNIKFNEDISLGEDLLFNLDYLKVASDVIKIVNKPLYNYILRSSESLDNKYYTNLFDIYKKIFDELFRCLLLFGANMEVITPYFYNSFLHNLNNVLTNTFHKNSQMSLIDKLKYNSTVLKSNEFKQCLRSANFNGFKTIYVLLLKTQNYLLVYIFYCLNNFRIKYMK